MERDYKASVQKAFQNDTLTLMFSNNVLLSEEEIRQEKKSFGHNDESFNIYVTVLFSSLWT